MNTTVELGAAARPVDDRPLLDAMTGMIAYQALVVAHELELFSHLGEGALTMSVIGERLGLSRRAAEALLSMCKALQLVREAEGRYWLTPLSETYLVESSRTFYGGVLDMGTATRELCSLEVIRSALQGRGPKQAHNRAIAAEAPRSEAWTPGGSARLLHGFSTAAARAWPPIVDLSQHQRLLDIGGGSGAHLVSALQRWPEMRGILFDIPSVCEAAGAFLQGSGLEARVTVHAGDMWRDAFPTADVHLYGSIFQSWSFERCRVLARKSFESLPPGGRILVHQMLLDDDKAGPFTVAAYNVALLLRSEGQQYTGAELAALLTDVGFTDVETRPTFGYWSMVSAKKA